MIRFFRAMAPHQILSVLFVPTDSSMYGLPLTPTMIDDARRSLRQNAVGNTHVHMR